MPAQVRVARALPIAAPRRAGVAACPVCDDADSAVAHVGRHVLQGLEIVQETRVCRACGLTFEHATPDLDWEKLYGTVWQRGVEQASHHALLYDNDARILGPGGGRRVLDVGCGAGFLLDRLAAQGWRTAGCEPEAAVAAEARAKGHEVVTDVFRPRAEHRCDLLILGDILEHAARPRDLLAGVREVLAADGRLYVRVPRLGLEEIDYESFGDVFGLQHRVWFTPDTLRSALAAEGFLVERVEPWGKGMNALARRVAAARPPALAPGEPERSIAVVETYSRHLAERRARIAAALERLRGKRVALYGAGAHGAELLAGTVLGELASAIVDGNPALLGTRCGGLAVAAPASLRADPPDVVVVASKAYQDEIAASLTDLAARGVEVVKLYAHSGQD